MKSRKPLQQSKKNIRRKQKKGIIIFLLVVFIFFDFVWIMNHNHFKIDNLEIQKNKTISSSDIEKSIIQSLSKKAFGLFPRDNVLLTNTKKIEKDIKNDFPKIYNAEVVIKDGSKLIVSIEEREPHSLWCRNEDYESSFDEECFFADQRGFIYTKAPYFSGGVFEKIYTTNELLQIGEQVLTKDDFSNFFNFTQSLSDDYGISVDRVFVSDRNETRIYINSLLKNNFIYKPFVIYNNNDSYELIHRNIGLMIQHDLFTKEFEKYPERLEFIDTRISDQIRYKFTPLNDYLRKLKVNEYETNTETNEY